MSTPARKTCLICIDGWGVTDEDKGNAVLHAETPVMDAFAKGEMNNAYATLDASGLAVGLPEGLMGNSEVGHQNIGAGQVVFQDIARIDVSLKEGTLAKNKTLIDTFEHVKSKGSSLHIMGLVSDGGVHSHIRHLLGLLKICKAAGVSQVFVHAFTDGRDTPPLSSPKYIEQLQTFMKEESYGSIATAMGRYFAMDRDKRWDRVALAYEGLVNGVGEETSDLIATIKARHGKEETDEFLKPIIVNKDGLVKDNDAIVFLDFRADRMREICQTFGYEKKEFETSTVRNGLHVVCMTQYNESFPFPILFPPQPVRNVLADWFAQKGIKQYHTAETEKYAHVTFFFNGRVEKEFPLEERCLVPSPKVATYDLDPQMSQAAVGVKVAEAVASGEYPFIVCNIAPPDMVGHTGVYEATVQAVGGCDKAIGLIWEACKQHDTVLFITSDHGNAEQMYDDQGGPFTQHTLNFVPFVMADPRGELKTFNRKEGILADVAPTILKAMQVDIPSDMTGKSFV